MSMTKKQVLAAALGSVEKWELYHLTGGVTGNHNEPLCQLFHKYTEKAVKHECGSCPYKIITGKDNCDAGPFNAWSDSETSLSITLMYLFLLAIYFELKDNWAGYKAAIEGVK